MPARFTILASGSSGNASLLEVDGFGLLIDCGIGPRVLSSRLSAIGAGWKSVSAVLLTHTHGDHWHPLTLAHLRRLHIPLVAHPRHHDTLSARAEYTPLHRAGLTRTYSADQWFDVAPSLACYAVQVPHDSDPTFAFRLEAPGWAIGFASDVGHVTRPLTTAFAGVGVLAVEYNHDEWMQRTSGRPKLLIDRVLGANGHLSNAQAADLTRAVAKSAGPGGLRGLIQLHLSRECNRPELAAEAGRVALATSAPSAEVITSSQFTPSAPLLLTPQGTSRPVSMRPKNRSVQPTLPGFGAAEAG